MVNHLKQTELVPGKWYTCTVWSKNSFAKLKSIHDLHGFVHTEHIYNRALKKITGYWSASGSFIEMTDEQKIEYLPKGHVDYPKQELTVNTFEIW